MTVHVITADQIDADGWYIGTVDVSRYDGDIEIAPNLGVVKFSSITVFGEIKSQVGSSIKADANIAAAGKIHAKGNIIAKGWIESSEDIVVAASIEAGELIKAGWSILAEKNIASGGDIKAGCDIAAKGGIVAGGGIFADWSVIAYSIIAESICAEWNIFVDEFIDVWAWLGAGKKIVAKKVTAGKGVTRKMGD